MGMARILIIDDEASVRAALEQILKKAGHTLLLASDGQEGVRQHQMQPADLVITDLFMPNQDGVETILDFRRLAPQMPIIAISGNALGSDMLEVAKQLGAVAVLEKPFATEELLAAVNKALANKRG
jgi:CheY-like chemotaxis protein